MAGVMSKERLILGFHKLESDFFHRLVHDLGQDPTNMRWVIAFWLWLESAGHNEFIRRAYALPGPVVLRFVEEAVVCLRCLAGEAQDDGDSRVTSLPCTNAFLTEPIDDVGYFFEHRKRVLKGVTYMYKSVCLVACVGSNNSAATPRAPAAGNTSARGDRAAAPAPITSSPGDRAATLPTSSPRGTTPAPLMISSPRGTTPAPLMISSPRLTTPAPLMISSPRRSAPAPLTMNSPSHGSPAPLMMNSPRHGAPPALMMNSPRHGAPPALMMNSTDYGAPLMMNSPRHGAPPALMVNSPDYGAQLMMNSPDHGAPPALMMNLPEEHAAPLMMSAPAGYGAPLMMSLPGPGTPLMMGAPYHFPMPLSTLNPMASPWVPMEEQSALPEDYRSLFVTFSKGYPVSREDILHFFNSMFGPCVEAVILENVQPGDVPVYGRVVLRSPALIPVVLEGQQTAKFLINGRHLWARVYVPSSKLG